MRRSVILVGALFVGIPAAIVAINLFDRELRPEARAYFESGAPPKFSREAGWALLIGFDAPQGVDPRDHAAVRHGDVQRESQGRLPPQAGRASMAVRGAAELLCTPEKSDCLQLFRERPDAVADLAADNATLLSRYDGLRDAGGLADASGQLFFVTPTVPVSVLLDTQRVRLSQIAALAVRGRTDQAAALLEADAAFFRRWLGEARGLLAKMSAVRALSRDFLLAAELARGAPALPPAVAQALERTTAPLAPAERSFAPILRAEAWVLMGGIDRLIADPRKTAALRGATNPLFPDLAGRTMRRNDTLNRIWPLHAAWEAIDGVDSREIAAAIDKVRREQARQVEPDWTAVYNFAGRRIVAQSAPEVGDYVRRVRDLDALAATARCVVSLHASRVAPESAREFIAHGPGCRDPLSGGPLTWDASRNLIGFRPADPDDVRRFGGAGAHVAMDAY